VAHGGTSVFHRLNPYSHVHPHLDVGYSIRKRKRIGFAAHLRATRVPMYTLTRLYISMFAIHENKRSDIAGSRR
jgi:hypothetical protein